MIKIENLSKTFDENAVLKGIDIEIPEGQATALIGPNGSGKTTLMKALLGLVKPDSGTVTINGTKLNGESLYRRNIGFMPQIAQYPENMKVYELFDFIKELRGQEAVFEDELIGIFDLEKELDKTMRVLSGGFRQKVGATLSMMFDPKILFLDEPTAGLDPYSSQQFKEWIRRERENGKTILITSHLMSELEELTDHVIFLLEGKVRYQGTMGGLLGESKETKLEGAIARLMQENKA
ncbi:MAG: ABC transporter ATP-binding protein [Balneolaceae bacterium]